MSECPICTYHFHISTRKPRRMPCCIKTICEVCMQNCIDESEQLTCPFCRHQHCLPNGIETLPVDRITYVTLLNEKFEGVKKRIQQLSHLKYNILKSKNIATDQITICFKEMMMELKQRKAKLLSQVDLEADQKHKAVDRALESHKAFQLKMEIATRQQSSFESLPNEFPEDVEYDRLGINFSPAQIEHLTDTIKSVGHIRTIDYRVKERPDGVPETHLYSAIQMQPDDIPQVPDIDKKIPGDEGEIICPCLEWDKNTASSDITVSGTEISNTTPVLPPPDTGCRIQTPRHVMSSRPVFIKRGQRVIYHVKIRYFLKQVIEENMAIFETALTSSPVDAGWSQATGLGVQIKACPTHSQKLCLHAAYDNNLFTDIPLTRNQVGESRDLQLCFVLHGDEKNIHVIDRDNVRVVTSVTGFRFDRPLWVMMYVDTPMWSDMTGHLVSGNKVTLTQEMTQLLSSLTEKFETTQTEE